MRCCVWILALVLVAGCSRSKMSGSSEKKKASAAALVTPPKVVTPVTGLVGTVSMVNRGAGFVVLTFTSGNLPRRDQILGIYRNGLKVGEVRVTGPEQDINTVADRVAGEIEMNDEAREE
jgi:hypothetical protein